MESLTQKTGSAAVWQVGGGIWATVVRLGASIVLARALSPRDFGIFGMAILVHGLLVRIGTFGLATGLIAKKRLPSQYIHTCFWIVVPVRLTIFFLVVAFSSLIASFFHEARLESLIKLVALCFLIQTISIIPQALLKKTINFKAIAIVNAIAQLIESSTAVFLAVSTDLAYWSLAIAMLLSTVFSNLALVSIVGWRPRLVFSGEGFRYLFRFGAAGLGITVLGYLKENLDYLLVGRMLGAYKLGFYEFAYRLPHLVYVRITLPIGGVIFPALAQLQEDNKRLFRGLLKTTKFVSIVTFPALLCLIAVSDILVEVLWGKKWLAVVIPLNILCVSAILRGITQPVGAIFFCKNKPNVPFKISLFELFLTAISVGGLGYFYGLSGVALGMSLSVIPSLVGLYAAIKMINASFVKFLKEIYPVTICSVLTALLLYLLKIVLMKQGVPLVAILPSLICFGAITYLLAFRLLFRNLFFEGVDIVREVFSQFRA